MLAAWFGGRFERGPGYCYLTAKRLNGVAETKKTVDVMNIAAWNPVLFRLNNDRIILYFKLGSEIPNGTLNTYIQMMRARLGAARKNSVKGDIGGRGPVKK